MFELSEFGLGISFKGVFWYRSDLGNEKIIRTLACVCIKIHMVYIASHHPNLKL